VDWFRVAIVFAKLLLSSTADSEMCPIIHAAEYILPGHARGLVVDRWAGERYVTIPSRAA